VERSYLDSPGFSTRLLEEASENMFVHIELPKPLSGSARPLYSYASVVTEKLSSSHILLYADHSADGGLGELNNGPMRERITCLIPTDPFRILPTENVVPLWVPAHQSPSHNKHGIAKAL